MRKLFAKNYTLVAGVILTAVADLWTLPKTGTSLGFILAFFVSVLVGYYTMKSVGE